VNLKEKLAQLERSHLAIIGSTPEPATPRLDSSSFLPGEQYATASGSCWRNRIEFELHHRHGQFELNYLLRHASEHLQLVAKKLAFSHVKMNRLLFIDTETTGLSGGIGTLAFLIGVGYFDGNRFVIEQYLMQRFEEERVLLRILFDLIEKYSQTDGALVSFNGKSYDLPLLINRGIFHRLLSTTPQFLHLDLLHPARRLWKNALIECSLNRLETAVLQIQRTGDVPGSLIPEIYFRFLRTGDPRPLAAVLHHNQLDILSMVVLLQRMLHLYASKLPAATVPVDWLAMGEAFDQIQKYDDGLEFYSRLLQQDLPLPIRKQVLLRLALLYKKQRNYAAAIVLWQQALSHAGFTLEPYEELAKAYEHRLADLQKAKSYSLQALENIQLLKQISEQQVYTEEEQRLRWRLQRLDAKLKRKTKINGI